MEKCYLKIRGYYPYDDTDRVWVAPIQRAGGNSLSLPQRKTKPERKVIAGRYRGVKRNEFGEGLIAKHWNNRLQKENP